MPRTTTARPARRTVRRRFRRSSAVLAALAVGVPLAGCTGGPAPSAAPGLDERFLGGNTDPSPAATITPEPGSWNGTDVPAGYRVTLVSAGADDATATVVSGVQAWADREDVVLTALPAAADDDDVQARIEEAVTTDANLVLGAGDGVVDVFALLTAQHLDQQFLIVGAQLPEPTANVTSVVWPGARSRGTGLAAPGDVDPAAVTPDRVREALDAGMTSVLHDLTGIVIDLA